MAHGFVNLDEEPIFTLQTAFITQMDEKLG